MIFPRDGSLLKTARECVAPFYRLVLLLLLLHLFFDARRVGASALEQEDNEEEKIIGYASLMSANLPRNRFRSTRDFLR